MKNNFLFNLILSDKVVCNMKRLYPSWEVTTRLRNYYKSKLKLSGGILVCGILLFIALFIADGGNNKTHDRKIKRNDVGGGTKDVEMYYQKDGNTDDNEIVITVSERRLSDEEIQKLSEKFKSEIFEIILGGNPSLDEVTDDLNFVKSVSGFPFDISYRTDNPLLISKDGKIDKDRIEGAKEQLVKITLTVSYDDYKEDIEFFVNIKEKAYTKSELFDKKLKEAIRDADLSSRENEYYILPEKIGNAEVRFYDKKPNDYYLVLGVFGILAIGCFYAKDRDLQSKALEKDEELNREYASLINRFALFYNAGISTKNIWMKLCNEYLDGFEKTHKRNYLYEEMLVTRTQILSGKSEIEAYEEFAERINIPKYRTFIALIIQSISIGRKDVSIELKKEVDDAFLQRKNNAKKLLEEGSTKLLIPLFMMLIVVIVIVIFPAFYSM